MSPDDATAARTLDELRAAVARVESGAEADTGRDAPGSRQGRRRSPPPPPEPQDAEADPHTVARAVVLRLLTNSPKSRDELEKALARKGCDPDVAGRVLDRMEEVGLVDDEAYARAFVRSKQVGRGLATRALSHELRRKGVDDEVARGVLAEVDPDDERETARALVEKKVRGMRGLERQVQTRRLAGMLARKGYGSDVAMSVVRECLDALPEHQRD